MATQWTESKIAFIGGGNMAGAIIGGLLAKGMDKQKIFVAEPWDVNRDKMAKLGVRTTASNLEAAQDADIVLLAVKPQVAKTVCEELSGAWSQRRDTPLIISIAAGVTLDSLEQWSKLKDGRTLHVVRVMPNTPALVGEGASGAFAGQDVTDGEKKLTTDLLESVSKATEWVEKEKLLDIVTGLSGKTLGEIHCRSDSPGSGPAYFFAMVEHLTASATKLGLPAEQAKRLAIQTCQGAGKMLVESSEDPAQLRKNVTSPNGTTEAGLKSFEASGFAEIVDKAVKAATDRAEELGRTMAG
jgi:pyrroline-5-carboxylate reductase